MNLLNKSSSVICLIPISEKEMNPKKQEINFCFCKRERERDLFQGWKVIRDISVLLLLLGRELLLLCTLVRFAATGFTHAGFPEHARPIRRRSGSYARVAAGPTRAGSWNSTAVLLLPENWHDAAHNILCLLQPNPTQVNI